MANWNLPPKAKIYEAFSAVADRRVELKDATHAEVVSSSGDKVYKVKWSDSFDAFGANDSASTWQGYTGYPIIAVLLTLGTLHCDPSSIGAMAGVPWKSLNDKFKRDYDKAVAHVLDQLEAETRQAIVREAESVFDQLSKLTLSKMR